MTGATIILIIFAVFAFIVFGTMAVFFGRIVWAMRNPEEFKKFQENEVAAQRERLNKEREHHRGGKPSWAGRAFGAVFTLVGLIVVAVSVWQLYDIARGQFWTRTTCTMINSYTTSSSSGRSATTYRAEVEYSYNFNGQNYTGKRLNLASQGYQTSDAARRAIKGYESGSQVACYVNAQNPSESVLNRSPFEFSLYQNVLGIIICFGVGGALFYMSRRRQPRQSEYN
jgi:hypothetical protein